nr:hypothetical protein HK105_006533 [Polyrhizophydium stewartii]
MHEGTVQFSEIPSEMDMPSPAVFQKTPSNNTLAVPQHTAHGNRHGHHHRRPSSGARVVDDSLTSLGTRHHSHIDDLIHSLSAMPPQTELAVTGEALAALCARDDLDFVDWLVGRARVFSRVKPDQKTWIVERLVRHGKYVGMCGDGTNDCGALKAAHVGVALSDAEASIVAPFTSARKCVSDVPYLVREGRCALETSFIAFKYMTLYPIIQLTMSATLNQHGVAMSNNQFFFDDMFVVTMLALAMLYTRPADTLGRERPTDDLFSPVVLVSIAGQVVVAIAFFAINVAVTVAQPWFCSADEATAGLDPMFRPLNAIDPHTDTSQDLLVKSFENTSIWLYSHFMFAVVAAAVSLTTHFCRPVWTNVFFTAYLGAITAVLLALLLLVVNESSARMPGPEEYADAVSWLFSIQPGVPPLFRLAQAGLLLAYTACAVLWETRVVDVYVRRAAAEAEALKIRMLDAKREAAVGIVNAQTAAAVGRSSRVSRSSDPPGADAADGDDYAEDAGLLAPAERVRLRPIRPAPSASPAGDKYASIDRAFPLAVLGVDCCTHPDVHCDAAGARIIGLAIPDPLGDLSALETLNLYYQGWAGPIPDSLGRLTSLRSLDLGFNQLSGSLPSSFGNLTNLVDLNLVSNWLNGTLPESIGGMTSLQTLRLTGSQMTGPIPESIGKLVNLREISFAYNRFTGPIPDSIGNLDGLQILDLSNNKLNGSIPLTIGLLSSATKIDLSGNAITGPIPRSIGHLQAAQSISLASNHLQGEIPSTIAKLAGLQGLNLSGNNLTGAIPTAIGGLTGASFIQLDTNQLTGPIPDVFGTLTKLNGLSLNDNNLTGTLPPSIAGLQQLTSLYIGNNPQLSGQIPSGLHNLQRCMANGTATPDPAPSQVAVAGSVPSEPSPPSDPVNSETDGGALPDGPQPDGPHPLILHGVDGDDAASNSTQTGSTS